MASAGFNEESVEKRFMSVTNTQDSIQGLSLWILHHKTHHTRIVELWYKAMKRSVKPSHRLTLFYLCNDVVQTCKRKKANIYLDTFKPMVQQASALVRDVSIKPKVERIFNIWEERQVFDKDFVTDLKAVLDGKPASDGVFKKPHSRSHSHKSKDKAREKAKERAKEKAERAKEERAKEKAERAKEKASAELSPGGEEFEAVQPADPTLLTAEKEKEKAEDVDAPSEETLAAFKPPEMIEKIRTFKHQAAEVDIKVRQLSHLKLDASSIEAIKQLKDRAHGNEFSTQFEESCLRLEDAVKGLEKKIGEQRDVLSQLTTSEYFYDQQYREAKIVANAYKNYGSRINTMKRKVDDLVRSLPSSPSREAPSPGNTPPLENTDNHLPMGVGEDDDMPSPPDEAPSPGSSPGDTVMKGGSSSLENRLASFISPLQAGSGSGSVVEERPIPVYVPQPLNSNGNTSSRRPSANKTLTEPDVPFPEEEEGGGTPLTDEQPSTPVMDEEPGDSPSPPPPPPPPPEKKKKKENPIDFLSRLISQTQKTKPVGASTSNSFLESFSLLTSKVKESINLKNSSDDDDDDSNAGDSPGPKSWKAWKAEKAAKEDVSIEPSGIPMGIPPPPISNFALPPPPPPTSLAPPIVPPMGVPPVMAMPVPPPVSSSPFFQLTSPGQKENWPEVDDRMGDGGDSLPSPNMVYPPMQDDLSSSPYPPMKSVVQVKSILRKPGNSVLKELTPSSEDSSSSSSMLAPPPPPPPPPLPRSTLQSVIGDGSAISTLGSGSDSEALEFREKLKRKTSVGGIPSSYTPNPIRPNLMTLTPGGEMDMDLDDEEEEEGEEEDEDETPRIPVLSSVVRRVDPVEQKIAREKEMHQLRERDSDIHGRDLHEPPSSAPPPRGDTFQRERRYSRENRDNYYPPSSSASSSGYGYRDNRSYGYVPEEPDPYYQPYPPRNSQPNFYGEAQYSNNGNYFGPTPPKRPFIKHGNNRGGNRQNYPY
ncbi:regulation of nuclear pre-mRNA domain-containing protein 2-like isoform X2 [Littorina saxatilis]|uniref:Regulation of nuclear pre-mRNA domain-containing protein 2 n=1 Tax=Littorina saxatilis TaxID=31220 RepID=A0AAN9GQJ0_9CAEN